VELYEAKGEAKTGKGGVGAKTFEFLLIPRVSGKVVLPGISVSFFDPNKKMYTTHSTEPIEINVAEAAPGSAAVSPGKRPSAQQALDPAANAVDDFHYLKASGDSNVGFQGYPWWRWLYWLSVLGFVCFVGFVLFDKIQGRFRGMRSTREAKALANSKSWQRLRLAARKASDGIAWNEVTATYELLCGAVYDVLDEAYDVGSRSLSRSALREALVNEKGLSSEIWKRVEQLLEFAEMVRFASSAGVVSEAAARTQLARWVAEGEIIAGELADKL
jgi:hypothetical protein